MKDNKTKQVRSWLLLSLCFLVLICTIYFVLQQRTQTKNHVQQYSETLTDIGFDTFVTYTETTDQETFQEHLQFIKERFIYYNKLFDYYHTYEDIQNLCSINEAAGKTAVKVDTPLLECIQKAYSFYQYSDHFDATQGTLLNVWHQYREEGIKQNKQGKSGSLPALEELQTAYNPNSWDAVDIDEANNRIYIKDKNVSIDLGGIAKGYAVEKIYEDLTDKGVNSAILNAGGNVMVIGSKTDGEPWRVGIQTPSANELETANIAVLSLEGTHAIVTSGDYQRYYEADGKLYSHIIDPTTLYPARFMRSVTVVCDDSTLADCLSTTLFTLSYKEGKELVNQLQQKNIQVQAVWVFDDTCFEIPNDEYTLKQGDYTILFTPSLQKNISK